VSSQYSDNLRTAYDRQAMRRDQSGIESWKVEERANYLSILQKEGKHNLLEIGSGPGRDGIFFQKAGLSVTCIDLSPEMIRLCLEKGLNAILMDVTDLSFPDNTFDCAYALNSLLHLTKSELRSVLNQLRRKMVPGGLLFVGVYGGQDYEGIWENDQNEPKRFFSFFTEEHLRKMVSGIFRVLNFRTIHFERSDSLDFYSLILINDNNKM
jgi:SAM-dependent methyltransferase